MPVGKCEITRRNVRRAAGEVPAGRLAAPIGLPALWERPAPCRPLRCRGATRGRRGRRGRRRIREPGGRPGPSRSRPAVRSRPRPARPVSGAPGRSPGPGGPPAGRERVDTVGEQGRQERLGDAARGRGRPRGARAPQLLGRAPRPARRGPRGERRRTGGSPRRGRPSARARPRRAARRARRARPGTGRTGRSSRSAVTSGAGGACVAGASESRRRPRGSRPAGLAGSAKRGAERLAAADAVRVEGPGEGPGVALVEVERDRPARPRLGGDAVGRGGVEAREGRRARPPARAGETRPDESSRSRYDARRGRARRELAEDDPPEDRGQLPLAEDLENVLLASPSHERRGPASGRASARGAPSPERAKSAQEAEPLPGDGSAGSPSPRPRGRARRSGRSAKRLQ